MYKIIITNYTDPCCTWCWGSEPIFRRLETHFPGLIEFRYVMGGLVKNYREMRDPRNGISGADADFNRQVATHWEEASLRHGMPVDAENFNLFSEERPSTYPLCIAYKAAQMATAERADLFLYNLRVATAAEARITNDETVLMQIADESGIDIISFKRALRDGAAERAFNGDMALMRSTGATGFPTFSVKYDGFPMLLRGWRDYETFVEVIDTVSHGEVRPIEVTFSADALLNFMELHPRMAAEEIRQAFDFASIADMERTISPLLANGSLERVNVGNGYFIVKRAVTAGTCDLVTGICS